MGALMANWYQWDSWVEFNSWQEQMCIELGYPLQPINEATGEIDPNAQPTLIYTVGYEVENKIIAVVKESESEGLTPTILKPSPPAPLLDDE